jgi:hypothetical protein
VLRPRAVAKSTLASGLAAAAPPRAPRYVASTVPVRGSHTCAVAEVASAGASHDSTASIVALCTSTHVARVCLPVYLCLFLSW